MGKLRCNDLTYSQEYWQSLDGGNGAQDSVMWEEIAHCIKEVFAIDLEAQKDNSPNIKCLEMGCGYGFFVRHMRRRGIDAWGVDFSQYALDHAPEDTKEFLRLYDMTSIDPTFFGWGEFDLVTSFETLEHIPTIYEGVDHALLGIYRSLKPGGYAIMNICTSNQPGWDTDPTHVTIETYDWWAEKLRLTGFIPAPDKLERLMSFWLFHFHKGVFVVQRPVL